MIKIQKKFKHFLNPIMIE